MPYIYPPKFTRDDIEYVMSRIECTFPQARAALDFNDGDCDLALHMVLHGRYTPALNPPPREIWVPYNPLKKTEVPPVPPPDLWKRALPPPPRTRKSAH